MADSGIMHAGGTAEYLHTSVATLKRWRRVGTGPPTFPLGGTRCYLKDRIDERIRHSEAAETREPAAGTAT